VKVHASAKAAEFIREHGGRIYVWASGAACCGGTRFIESSTESPDDLAGFVAIERPEFALFVRPAGGALPDELHVDLRGWRTARVEASWNGCAYLV
jgi:hypothetical protein